MKVFQLAASVAVLSTSVWGQMFSIASPHSGDVLTAGQQFTVQVEQPVAQGVFQPLYLILGLQRCFVSPCPGENDSQLGEILYHGDFNPQRHENTKRPYQNFTFTLGDTNVTTPASLHAVHLFLVGAGPTAQMASTNVSVSIQPNA